jgi:hypothetical protein
MTNINMTNINMTNINMTNINMTNKRYNSKHSKLTAGTSASGALATSSPKSFASLVASRSVEKMCQHIRDDP